MKTFRCKACRRVTPVNPRNLNQKYCSHADCQRARKREWQRNKRASDPDYRQNQIDCQKRWRERHPGYWQDYRKRKKRALLANPPDAKMDGLLPNLSISPGAYLLSPVHGQNIKMDAFQAIIFPIPVSYDPAKDDIIEKLVAIAYDHLKNNGQVPHLLSCSQ